MHNNLINLSITINPLTSINEHTRIHVHTRRQARTDERSQHGSPDILKILPHAAFTQHIKHGFQEKWKDSSSSSDGDGDGGRQW